MSTPKQDEQASFSPVAKLDELSTRQKKEVEEQSRPNAALIHETIRAEGEAELSRTAGALFLSAIAAGLSMGFSLLTKSILQAYLPDAKWAHLIASFGYTTGFLIVVIGRQQLFTENTLTPILPLLHNRDLATFKHVLRLWAIVLIGNILATFVCAYVLARTPTFDESIKGALLETSRHVIEPDFITVFWKAVFAGWLIALMVWLLPGAESSRVSVIVIITYLIALADLSHLIAGSVDAFYLVVTSHATLMEYALRFFAPTLIGNVVGGVALVAALNFGQAAPETE
jgi:formate/nitrite transporter FocA (FNT family)